MKLLYVEGDPAYAQLLRDQFSRGNTAPSDLVHAGDLAEALGRLSEESFDCVLLEQSVPEGDGSAACCALCAANAKIPVVVAAATDCGLESALEAGAEDYLIRREVDTEFVAHRLRFAAQRRKHEISTGQLTPAGARQQRSGCSGPVGLGSGMSLSWGGQSDGGPSWQRQRAAGSMVGTPGRPLRLLQIEGDTAFARLLQDSLTGDLPICFSLERAGNLAEGLRRLDQEAFDAILLDLLLPDSNQPSVVGTVCSHANGSPVLVVTDDDDEASGIRGLQQGAQDCLVKSRLGIGLLVRSVRLAVARQARRSVVFDPGRSKSLAQPTGRPTIAPGCREERREHGRYLLAKSIYAIPVLPDGTPATTQAAEGLLNDVSTAGIGFEVAGIERIPTRELVVGVEADDGVLYFATVEVRHASATAGGLRAGGRFVSAQRDLLRSENLLPTLDPRTYHFATGLPEETLFRWVELGIFRPMLVDRILVCPQCQAVPTFRNGCRACGSVRLASCQLIHHFACAHVGFVADFECEGEIICPKCRTRGLVVGTDFEHLDGPYRCMDCKWSDTELEFVGQCLRCGLRFPAQQLSEKELIGYHVNRLDPLALIGSS